MTGQKLMEKNGSQSSGRDDSFTRVSFSALNVRWYKLAQAGSWYAMVCGISYKYQFLPTFDLNLEFFRFGLPNQNTNMSSKAQTQVVLQLSDTDPWLWATSSGSCGTHPNAATDAIYPCSQVTPDAGGWWWHGEIGVFWLGRRGDVFWKWDAKAFKKRICEIQTSLGRSSITWLHHSPKQMHRNLKLQELLGTVWDIMIMEQNSVKQNRHVSFQPYRIQNLPGWTWAPGTCSKFCASCSPTNVVPRSGNSVTCRRKQGQNKAFWMIQKTCGHDSQQKLKCRTWQMLKNGYCDVLCCELELWNSSDDLTIKAIIVYLWMLLISYGPHLLKRVSMRTCPSPCPKPGIRPDFPQATR